MVPSVGQALQLGDHLLQADLAAAASCQRAKQAMKLARYAADKENLPPNVLAQETWQAENQAPPARSKGVRKGVRKVKKVQRVAAAPAAPEATGAPDASSMEVVRSESPRARKQQRVGDGRLALLQACLTGAPATGGSWQVSPPLSKVQERHTAFEVHSKAMVGRGPSGLAESAREAARVSREVDGLASGVEMVCALR